MEKEETEHDKSDASCEIPILLKGAATKNDKESHNSDLNEFFDDKDIMTISEVTFDNTNVEDMDLEEVLEEKNYPAPVEVGNNSMADGIIGETSQETTSEKSEVQVSSKTTDKGRQETDFVSDDAKENSDNFDAKWNYLKSLSENGDKYSFIRKRWGNAKFPDPSIDLTYRHRLSRKSNRGRDRGVKKSKNRKNKFRSLTCVSHVEKMMNDVKNDYYSELKKLCERHCLNMIEVQKHYQSQFITLIQYSLNSMHFNPKTAQDLLLKQRQEEMLQADNYQKQIQNLVNKTNSSLARYEKFSEEILVFHKQYQVGGDAILTREQLLHLQDTERMYKEYEKFYC